MRVRLTGEGVWQQGYSFPEQIDGHSLHIVIGQVVDLPKHVAARVLRDYPKDFLRLNGDTGHVEGTTVHTRLDLERLRKRDAEVRVGAIVTTFNGLAMTARCLHSLEPTDGTDLEVYVVDNCSTDGTYEWLQQNHVPFEQPLGRCSVAEALNRGQEHYLGREDAPDYLLVMNNDVVLPTGYLAALVSYAEEHRDTGWVVGIARHIYDPEKFTEPVDIDCEMLSGDASATLHRVAAMEQIGPWDERFRPRYGEDEDYLIRTALHGWRQVRLPVPYDGDMGGYTVACPGEARQEDCHRVALGRELEKWGDLPKSTRRFRAAFRELVDTHPCQGTDGREEPPPVLRRGKRAAVIQNGHMGDIIWTFGVAAELKRRGYSVRWYAIPPYLEIVDCCPDVDEVVDTERLGLSSVGNTPFERAATTALEHAERDGIDRIVAPQIAPLRQREFLSAGTGYLRFMYDSIGYHPASLKFELRPEPNDVTLELVDLDIPDRSLYLNLASESMPLRQDWAYWDRFIELLADEGVTTFYNEPPGVDAYRWRGKQRPRIIGKLTTRRTLLYLAQQFSFYVSSSSGPMWSAFHYGVPALVLIPRSGVSDFPPGELIRQYAFAHQGWLREWEAADVVTDERGTPERWSPAELASVVVRRLDHGHDVRAFEIEQYADIVRGGV